MFKIGELVIYSMHGVCQIDEISDKTFGGKTRTYYVLHPVEDAKLKISVPVHNDKVNLLKVMGEADAEKVIESFGGPGAEWIDDVKKRNKTYQRIIQSGDREDISQIIVTLTRKCHEAKQNKKHVSDQDKRLLNSVKNVLFKELALALHTTNDDIADRVEHVMNY